LRKTKPVITTRRASVRRVRATLRRIVGTARLLLLGYIGGWA
jgi:hypothetical protein